MADEPKEKSIKELAKEHTEKALVTLRSILDNDKASDMAKIQAATALLDRGHGKPTQYVEATTKVVTYQDLLTNIADREDQFQITIEAQAVKEIAPPKATPTWADIL